MSKGKFHVSEDGVVRPCTAQTPDACTAKGLNGEKSEHFDSMAEGEAYSKKVMEEKHGAVKPLRKGLFGRRKSSEPKKPRRSLSREARTKIAAGATVAAVLAGSLGGAAAYEKITDGTSHCTGNDKQIVVRYDEEKDRTTESLRVYTDECGVMEVENSVANLSISKNRTFGEIKTGEVYEMDHYGIEFQPIGMYKQVYKVSPLDSQF